MNQRRAKPEWEIRFNIDGITIITIRVTKDVAERMAKSFGLELEGDYVAHWPMTICKIGARVELEQEALANILAPKLAVKDGEIMLVLSGCTRKEPSESAEWMNLDQVIKKIYEVTEGKPDMKWNLAIGEPGTLIPGPPR